VPRSRRRKSAPVLLPAAPPPDAPLPRAVPLLALLGLAILFFCTLPAVRAQDRLQHEHARLREQVEAAEAEIGRLSQQLRGGATQSYLRIKARQDLLHGGADYIRERDARLGR
jgi:cytochrome c-type biogenesis protein CcmH/NrfG